MLISHTVLMHRGLSPNVKKETLLDIYVPNNKVSKYMGKYWQNYKEKWIKLNYSWDYQTTLLNDRKSLRL